MQSYASEGSRSPCQLSGLLVAGAGINGCSLKTEENLAVMAQIPTSRLLLETDSPYCDVRPSHAGKVHVKTSHQAKDKKKYDPEMLIKGRNEPCNIVSVFEVVTGETARLAVSPRLQSVSLLVWLGYTNSVLSLQVPFASCSWHMLTHLMPDQTHETLFCACNTEPLVLPHGYSLNTRMNVFAQFYPQTVKCFHCSSSRKGPEIVHWLAGHRHVQDIDAFADDVFDNTMRMFFQQ